MIFDIPFEKAEILFLVFLRISGFIYASPIFSHSTVSNQLKVAFSFAISASLFFQIPMIELPEAGTVFFLLICSIEVMVGLLIGVFITFLFELLAFGAYLIDYQMGFGFVNIVDPARNIQVSVTSIFYSLLGLTLFVVLDFHHYLIEALLYSYKYITPGTYILNTQVFEVFKTTSIVIFKTGIKIGAPAIIIVFITEVIIGIIGRAVPKFQILIIGFPIKIATGFIGISFALVFFKVSFIKAADSIINNMDTMIKVLGS